MINRPLHLTSLFQHGRRETLSSHFRLRFISKAAKCHIVVSHDQLRCQPLRIAGELGECVAERWQRSDIYLGGIEAPPEKRAIIETLATACSVSRRCDDLLSFYLFIVITVTVGNDNVTTTGIIYISSLQLYLICNISETDFFDTFYKTV